MEALKKVKKMMVQHNLFLALAVILTIMVGISYIFLGDEPRGAQALRRRQVRQAQGTAAADEVRHAGMIPDRIAVKQSCPGLPKATEHGHRPPRPHGDANGHFARSAGGQ